MKIATYNVRNLYDPGTFLDDKATQAVTEEFFNRRIAYFTEQLKSLDLDIICLQEIGGGKGISSLSEALGFDYFSARPNKRGIRMSVLFRKELKERISCQSVSLGELYVPSIVVRGDTKDVPPITNRRDVLAIDVDCGSKKVRLVTFHLKSLLPEYLEGDDIEHDSEAHADAKFRCILYKMMELRALRSYATKTLGEGMEVVFLGDFNDNNNSSGVDVLRSGVDDTAKLYDILVGYEGNKKTHIHRGNDLTFDTMLISQGLKEKVKKISVENKDLRDFGLSIPSGGLEYEFQFIESDHALVWADFEI